MFDERDRKWLYERMQSSGVNTGSYDEFKSSLANQEDFDWYYNKSKELGLDVGSVDDFRGMMVEPSSSEQSVAESVGSTTPEQKPSVFRQIIQGAEEQARKALAAQNDTQPTQAAQPTQPKKQQPINTEQEERTNNAPTSPVENEKPLGPEKFARQMEFERRLHSITPSPEALEGDFSHRVENIRRGNPVFGGERKGVEYNPTTGEFEDVYYDRYGNEFNNSVSRDWHERNIKRTEYEQKEREKALEANINQIYDDYSSTIDESIVAAWENANKLSSDEFVEKTNSRNILSYALTPAPSQSAQTIIDSRSSHYKYHDLQRLADEAWNGIGKEAQENMINSIYAQLKEANGLTFDDERTRKLYYTNANSVYNTSNWNTPYYDDGTQQLTEQERTDIQNYGILRRNAEKIARANINQRMYEYAKEQHAPKDVMDFFIQKVVEGGTLFKLVDGTAREVAHTTGDMEAREAALNEYGEEHPFANISGEVGAFVADPVNWIPGKVASLPFKFIKPGLALKFFSGGAGKFVQSSVTSGLSLAPIMGMQEASNQYQHGGVVEYNEDGRWEVGDYDMGNVWDATLRGGTLGLVTGGAGVLIKNAGNGIVNKITNSLGNESVGSALATGSVRLGEDVLHVLTSGTIFAASEMQDTWNKYSDMIAQLTDPNSENYIEDPFERKEAVKELEEKRDELIVDQWEDNIATMIGFHLQGKVKSAPQVLKTLANNNGGRSSFIARLNKVFSSNDQNLKLSADERRELELGGYTDLKELVDDYSRYEEEQKRNGKAGEENAGKRSNWTNAQLEAGEGDGIPYNRFVELIKDQSISEAARAKMYYYVTGHMLPMSTIMASSPIEEVKDANGKVTGYNVKSFGANGVITNRTFKNEKEAKAEQQRIDRQVELNSAYIGEQFFDKNEYDRMVKDACDVVGERKGASGKSLYEMLQRDPSQRSAVENEWVKEIENEMALLDKDNYGSENLRKYLNEKYDVDIDNVIGKEPNRRNENEKKALHEYYERLFADAKKEEDTPRGRGYNASDTERNDIAIELAMAPEKQENREAWDGVVQRVKDDADYLVAQMRQEHEVRRSMDDGAEHPLVMKEVGDDGKPRELYLHSGNLVTREDGSIDEEHSEQTVTVFDPVSGEVKMISPNDIASAGAVKTDEDAAREQEALRRQFIEDQINGAKNQVALKPGDTFPMPDGTEGLVVAVDGESVTVRMADGSQTNIPISEVQRLADETLFADYERRHPSKAPATPEAASEEQSAQPSTEMVEGVPAEFEQDMEVTVRDEDGNEKTVVVTGVRARWEDGKFIEDPNGRYVEMYDPEANSMIYIHETDNKKIVGWKEAPKEEQSLEVIESRDDQEPPDDGGTPPPPTAGVGVLKDAKTFEEQEKEQKGPKVETPETLTPETYLPESKVTMPAAPVSDNAVAMPMVETTKGRGKTKRTETSPDWYAATPSRTQHYIYNELGFTPEVAGEIVKANMAEIDEAIESLTKKEPKPTANPLAYKEAHDAWENEMQTLKEHRRYWDEVREIRQGELTEELKKKEAERLANETAEQKVKREAFEAEQARRQAEAEEAARRRKEEDEQKASGNYTAPVQMTETTEPIEGTRTSESQLDIAKRELADDAEAMEILNDNNPHTLEELASIALRSGKGQIGIIPEDFYNHTGYSPKDAKAYSFILSNNGVTISRLGEIVEGEARNWNIPFDENDATAGLNAVLAVLGEVQTQGDINGYITNNRIRQAYEHHNEMLAREEDLWIEAHDGLTRAEYEAWERSIEENDAALNGQNYDEYYNKLAESTLEEYDNTKSTTDDGRSQEASSGALQGQEGDADADTRDGVRGVEEGGSRDESGPAEPATPTAVAERISAAEAQTDTNPTEGQKKAGNYAKGHLTLDGYNISIEQPKGSIRRGVDADGRAWEQEMHNTYGYIRGTEGVDGDHIDVFLSDDPTQGNVFVIDQVNKDGSFDEHKVMYGFPDAESARAAYLSNYEEGWQGLGTITEVSKDEFKKWVESSHRKTKPFSEYKSVEKLGGQNEVADEEDLASRMEVNYDGETAEEDPNGTIYRRPIVIDGIHRVEQVNEPDEKGYYTGSYYMYNGKRYGDLREVFDKIDKPTAEQREIGQAMVDQLERMGMEVSTDIAENRRVLKQAEQDKSEAGKLRHFRTSDGKIYGFTYRGKLYLDPRHIDAELPIHEYAHPWCEAMRYLAPDKWAEVVDIMKADAETWDFIKKANPDLTDENDIAEEMIATYSGKNGKEKAQAEYERMSAKGNFGNMWQNIAKAIQDFWKKIGDFLGIKYESAEQVYDQVVRDFANKINPRKRIEDYLKARDEEYMQAVESGDEAKAKELFDEALRENIGNGMTPYVSAGGYRGDLAGVARGVKRRDPDMIRKAAELLAPVIPQDAVLVPAPSHTGEATDMLDLANAIAEITGVPVADILKSEERASQYETKRESGQPMTSDQMGITMDGALPEGKMPVVIDNVVDSGNTAEACIKALGTGVVASIADAADRYRHVASLKSANAVVRDKNGNVVPLSKRFEMGGSGYLAKQKGDGAAVEFTPEEKATQKALDEMLGGILGKDYVVDAEEGQRVLEAERSRVTLQKRIDALSAAETFIEESLKGKHRGQRFEVELPKATENKVRRVMGRDFGSHNIYADGIVHSKNNHGENGKKIDENSIPLRDEDFGLAPYIMVAPDRVTKGSMGTDGRESIRFEKKLSNGVVLVVEKEQKNSPDDMDTITMWADLSSRVSDARSEKRPLSSTSTPANNDLETNSEQSNAVTVITSFDAAKIRKDAETAIEKDEKIKFHKADDGSYEPDVKPVFFKGEDGEVLGYTLNGKVYIDPRVATTETRVHEYSHLWAQALRNANPKAWEQLKSEMMSLTDLVDYVRKKYPEFDGANGLNGSNEVSDEFVEEVFAHYSGKRGAERLEAEMREEMKKADGIFEKAQVANIFHKLRDVLQKFWSMSRDLFAGKVKGVENLSAEDFADMALGDLLGGFDPRVENKKRVKERDKEYMEAVERGDMETAQRMVVEEARKKGYISDEEYRMSHTAPNGRDGFSKSIADPTDIYPEDLYGPNGARYYGDGERWMDVQSANIFKRVHHNPEAMVKVYRAVPKSLKETKLRNGDWVSISREYAKGHGERSIDGGYKIIEDEVPAKYIFTDDNSLHEQGYDDGKEYAYQNTKNNRKLLDAVTYDDNGNVIPLSQRFNKRNADVRYQKSGTYTTRDGVQLSMMSLFEGTENLNDNANLNDKGDLTALRLRKLEPGETCLVERRYEESKQFSFMGKERIESMDDVAYIFKQLEDAAVENSFVVLVKDGKPTIIHTGMGGYNYTPVEIKQVMAAYESLKPEKVYFVHNHPSGTLKASTDDRKTLLEMRAIFGDEVVQDGIIIDTTSGKYGVFGYDAEERDMLESADGEVPMNVYEFSKQVFSEGWKPQTALKIVDSKGIAEFISSQRFGEHPKMSFIIVNNQLQVVGNLFLPWTKLSDIKDMDAACRELSGNINLAGGMKGIIYGNYQYDKNDKRLLQQLTAGMKAMQTPLLDVVHVDINDELGYHSAHDAGVMEPEADYVTPQREAGEDIFAYAKRIADDYSAYEALVKALDAADNGVMEAHDDSVDDIMGDRSLGLQERITAMATRLAERHKDDMEYKNNAYRAIGGNLASLRRAMFLQKEFDKGTVKRVADLARVLIQGGYLDDMSKGEVSRLLSAVKNSTGHVDIRGDVQKVMDVMVDSQLRRAEKLLQDFESIKGSKVNVKGVEVQGQLDIAGQQVVKSFKETRGWGEKEIEEAMAEAQERMGSDNAAVSEEAANEYAGLQMALEYVQNIKASKVEERELKLSLDDAKRQEDRSLEYEQTLEDAIRQNRVERLQAYHDLMGRLGGTMEKSIESAQAFKDAEKERVREIQHNANSDMTGRPSDEHYHPKWKDKFVNNSAVQFFFSPLATFDQMLRLFGSKSANGEGYLYNRFMRGLIDARQKEIRGVREKYAVLDQKVHEIFGKEAKSMADLIRLTGKMPKAVVIFKDGGELKEHKLTQGNLMYIYMVNQMLDGRMKLRNMGIDEKKVAEVERILDSRLKELADWMQEEFLVDTRNGYNETHKRMFGAPMAAIEHYFPLKINANARVDKVEDLDNPNMNEGISTKTGSIIKRRMNALPLDITNADALNVILEHVAQMEHWNAFAEYNRDLNILRTYKHFRNQVKNMRTIYGSGNELWKNFNDVCQMATGSYRPQRAKLDKSATNIAKGVTAAKVSFRIFTALKQFLSSPAYLSEARPDLLAKNLINPVGAWKWSMEHLPIFEERWKSRIAGDPRLMKSELDWKGWRNNIVQMASRVGMSPNAFVDAVTVSIGAHAIYETKKAQYLKDGYSEEQAEKRAIQDAEVAYNQTQQSSEGAFTSTMQVDRSWLSVMFTVFRNASMAYQRQLHDALRNTKRNLTPGHKAESIEFMAKQMTRDGLSEEDAIEAAKRRYNRQLRKDAVRIGVFGYIMQFAWNLGAYLPYLLFGDDDDKKEEMWDDILTKSMFGWGEGLTGGDVMSEAGKMLAKGEGNAEYLKKEMPLTSDVYDAIKKIGNGKYQEVIGELTNLVVQAGVGVNPQSITDGVLAIMDACGDDPALAHEAAIAVMRILQVPQSQLKQMYFDELGLSGEEVSQYTPAQLARRYAEYQVKRGRVYTPWRWDDEEAIGKEIDKANKVINERIDRYGGKEVNDAYAKYADVRNSYAEQLKEFKASHGYKDAAPMETAELIAEFNQEHAADYAVYATFDSMDKVFDKIVKYYLGAKSTKEAHLSQQAIVDYKRQMVAVMNAQDDASRKEERQKLAKIIEDFYKEYGSMQATQEREDKLLDEADRLLDKIEDAAYDAGM